MRATLWRLEWRLALRRRRLFALNVGIPLLLVIPLTLGGAPVFHASAALAVLFVLFGTFGSTIPLLREGEAGTLRRILLAGAPEARILGERAAAGTALDLVQLLPSLAVVLLAWGADPPVLLLALPVLVTTLLAANLVGIWVAALARSLAEGALFAAVVSLFLLHGSGVFRSAAPGSVGSLLEAILPFAPLHRLILAAGTGEPAASAWWNMLAPAGGVLVLFAATLLLAGPMLDRVAPSVRRG